MTQKEYIKLKSTTISEDATLKRLDAGEGNGQAYLVILPNKNQPTYFIKASDNESIQKFEVTLKDMLSSNGIPLPDTVETHFETEDVFVISEAIPNEYFDWKNGNAVITFLYEAADALSKLHNTTSSEVRTYFEQHQLDKVREDFTDWRINRYIATLEGNETYEDDIPELETVKEWINNETEYTPTIIHGDVHLPNILTNKLGEIQAIIDWEKASIGDPAYDLAKFECRTIDLYAPQTQFSHDLLLKLFRKLYGYSEKLEKRVDAHKHAYGIQFRETLQTYNAFEDWRAAEELNESPFDQDCIDRYNELLPYYRDNSPVN